MQAYRTNRAAARLSGSRKACERCEWRLEALKIDPWFERARPEIGPPAVSGLGQVRECVNTFSRLDRSHDAARSCRRYKEVEKASARPVRCNGGWRRGTSGAETRIQWLLLYREARFISVAYCIAGRSLSPPPSS
ncbi:uncharacterized protein A4U43_C01F25590 [Asparagus officinalis]|uniref:Uncharacterized protein n=1 Tax=Asparagus officinalis TaxID=4686 RepID=A0A5P1FUM8_ASPOF|nr:uncharacterized protein A4U43_C01F25590 [Asparagus officinalis]